MTPIEQLAMQKYPDAWDATDRAYNLGKREAFLAGAKAQSEADEQLLREAFEAGQQHEAYCSGSPVPNPGFGNFSQWLQLKQQKE